MGEPPFRRIAIYGVGLIGGSIALAAKRRWPVVHVVAIDRPHVVRQALEMRIADEGSDGLGAADGADLILLAAPVLQNIDALQTLSHSVRHPALVSDVSSTKRAILDASAVLPERLPFVGGHPLAGAATSGVAAARPDLFDDRPWVLTFTGREPQAVRDALSEFVTALRAIPHQMDAAEHDRLLAYLSHLPQLTVSALMHVAGCRAGADGLALAGRGLHDTTRLASSPGQTWRDIVATNRDNVGPALDDLIAALQQLKVTATAGDGPSDALERMFTSAARWKGVLEHT